MINNLILSRFVLVSKDIMASSRINHNRHVVVIQPDSNFEEGDIGTKKFKIRTMEDDDFSTTRESSNEEDNNLLKSKEYTEEGVVIRQRRRPPRRNDVDVPDGHFRQSMANFRRSVQETIIYLTNGGLSFITIKVFLWDILISMADIVSDFLQGYTLFHLPGKRSYGIASLAINWIPGLAGFIHVISMYRNVLPWYKVISFAFLMLILYPVIPLCSFVYLMYKKPKSVDEPVGPEFTQAQYFTTIIHAMTGGLESPIQLIFQVWLVLNGVILWDWNQVTNLTFTDPQGNTIYLPYTTSLCVCFSVVSILKALVDFNVFRVHNVKSDFNNYWSSFFLSLMNFLDFLPFLTSSAFFKIASLIGIMTYTFPYFGFVPLVLMFILSIIINQIILREVMDLVPNWLIIFMSLFVPACFNTKDPGNKNIDKIQARTFFWQTLASVIIYGSSIIAILVLVNTPTINFNYNEEIILNNQKFNVCGITVLVMGLISLVLSWSPRCSNMLKCCEVPNANPDEEDAFAVCFKIIWAIFLLGVGKYLYSVLKN